MNFERLRAGESKQLLRQAGAALRGVSNALQHPLELLLIGDVAQAEIGCAEDRRQQIVEVVREAAGQLPEGLHLLRTKQLLARFLQPQLSFALFRHIAGDLGETDQLAVFVPDRVDDDARPQACAVLANAPALGLVAARLARRLECSLWNPRVEVLGCVEAAEMLADDLARRVAL